MTPEALTNYNNFYFPIITPLAPAGWPSELHHYTKIGTFRQIVETKSLLMFNALTTNDFQEVLPAVGQLDSLLTNHPRVKQALDAVDQALPNFSKRFFDWFQASIRHDALGTHVVCFSAPSPNKPFGILSMWRAYGGDGNGICVGFKTDVVARNYFTARLPVVLFPVRYETEGELEETICKIFETAASCAPNARKLWQEQPDDAMWALYQALHIAVATRKHPGFAEELEWRAIALLRAVRHDDRELLKPEIMTVGDSLRLAVRLDLTKFATLMGTTLTDLVGSVVIGPCDDQAAMRDLIAELLFSTGVPNPYLLIKYCNIPYRRNR